MPESLGEDRDLISIFESAILEGQDLAYEQRRIEQEHRRAIHNQNVARLAMENQMAESYTAIADSMREVGRAAMPVLKQITRPQNSGFFASLRREEPLYFWRLSYHHYEYEDKKIEIGMGSSYPSHSRTRGFGFDSNNVIWGTHDNAGRLSDAQIVRLKPGLNKETHAEWWTKLIANYIRERSQRMS